YHETVPRSNQRERAVAEVTKRFQDVLEARGRVDRLAERVSQLELQPMGEALLERGVQRVVIGIGDCVLGKDAGKYRDTVRRAAIRKHLVHRVPTANGIAVGR